MLASSESFESRLFRSYWDDGLLDALAGVGVLAIAGLWAWDLVAVGAAVPAMVAALWGPLRRRLVEPRLGAVEFSDERQRKMHGVSLATVGLGVAVLLVCAGAAYATVRWRPEGLAAFGPAIPALLLALMAVVAGLALSLPRFVGYAAVWSVAGLVVAARDWRPEIAMAAGGLWVVVAGARRLQRVLQWPIESGGGD